MGNPYKGSAIPKEIMVRAIEMNKSMKQAAASIHVSYGTFKKYAILYDIWAPMTDPDKIYKQPRRNKNTYWTGKDELSLPKHNELKRTLIIEGIKEQKCDHCGYNHYRMSDMLSPLIIWFDNKDENDHTPDNIKFFCYNCYFTLYDVKFKPTQRKLSSYRKDKVVDNRFTQQIDDKINDVEETDKRAENLGKNLSAIFK